METKLTGEFWSYDERIKNARSTHFKRLNGVTYLDHAGATLYSECQLSDVFADLSSSVYGNPHSRCPSSVRSSEIVDEVRNRVLRHFNVSPDEYAVIFTNNCTAALKIVGESFDFQGSTSETQNGYSSNNKHPNPYSEEPLFAYLADNHTSVIGIREILKSRNVSFNCVTASEIRTFELSQQNSEHPSRNAVRENVLSNNLFAFPAQSNFSGQRYPLSWVKKIQGQSMFAGCHGNWYVLLDAASFLTTSTIDLTECQPDFVVLSFYKIFGYPTGLGALLVKRSTSVQLRKTYFGGGTVEAALATEDFHMKRKDLSHQFEDGTLPFLEILAVKHGFDSLLWLTGSLSEMSMHAFALAKYVHDQLVAMHHLNDSPLVTMYHSTTFMSDVDQGPIVNFNLLNSDGSFIGFAQVEKLAQLYSIHFRTGCFCNMGACQQHLILTVGQVKDNLKAGHVCGDDVDLIDGRPTGSIRISFGYCSTFSDAETFLRFIRECFLHVQPNKGGSDDIKEPAKTHQPEVSSSVEIPSDSFALNDGFKRYLRLNHNSSEKLSQSLRSQGRSQIMVGIQVETEESGFDLKDIEELTDYTRLVSHRNIGPRGLKNDREWMLINDSGVCISQKREPNMCCILPSIDEKKDHLVLSYPGFPSLNVPLLYTSSDTGSTQMCNSKVCGDRVLGSDCGEEAAKWLQSVLNKPSLRLVRQTVHDERAMSRNKTESKAPGKLSLANEAQFLLVGSASLKQLLARMRKRIENGDIQAEESCIDLQELLDRFRPNLIVKTQKAFEEEKWTSVQIGSQVFVSEGPCNRCQMVCVNQKTGKRTKEPLLSLIAMAAGRKSTFGILLRHVSTSSDAQLSLGDAVVPYFEDSPLSEP